MATEKSNLTLADLSLPADHKPLPVLLEQWLRDHFRQTAIPVSRARALEELWAATKELAEDSTGYTPRFTAACKRLRDLEKQP